MSEILKEGLMTSFSSFLVRGSLYASFLADQGREYNHICCGILCILHKWKMDSVYKATTTVLVLLAVLPIKWHKANSPDISTAVVPLHLFSFILYHTFTVCVTLCVWMCHCIVSLCCVMGCLCVDVTVCCVAGFVWVSLSLYVSLCCVLVCMTQDEGGGGVCRHTYVHVHTSECSYFNHLLLFWT